MKRAISSLGIGVVFLTRTTCVRVAVWVIAGWMAVAPAAAQHPKFKASPPLTTATWTTEPYAMQPNGDFLVTSGCPITSIKRWDHAGQIWRSDWTWTGTPSVGSGATALPTGGAVYAYRGPGPDQLYQWDPTVGFTWLSMPGVNSMPFRTSNVYDCGAGDERTMLIDGLLGAMYERQLAPGTGMFTPGATSGLEGTPLVCRRGTSGATYAAAVDGWSLHMLDDLCVSPTAYLSRQPGDHPFGQAIAVGAAMNEPSSTYGRFFVTSKMFPSNDATLYEYSEDQTGWNWYNHGVPPGAAGVVGDPIALRDGLVIVLAEDPFGQVGVATLEWDPTIPNWVWTTIGPAPEPIALVGNSPHEGSLIGAYGGERAVVKSTNGSFWMLELDPCGPTWSNLGNPCTVPTTLPGPTKRCFTPDRFSALPADRMQVVAAYDGNGTAVTLDIHLWHPMSGSCGRLHIDGITNSAILTEEYEMHGFEPTGVVDVNGVVANGVIDGVAFGLYLHNAFGDRSVLRSSAAGIALSPNFIGGWPVAWNEATWDGKMTSLAGASYDDFVARRQAQMTLAGAQVLPNGVHHAATDGLVGDLDGDGMIDGFDASTQYANNGAGCGTVVTPGISGPVTYTGDRFGAFPIGRMQVVVWYDGNGTAATLGIHVRKPATNERGILTVSNLTNAVFVTDEYLMNGWEPTGKFDINGVVANGVIDGVAFGLYWRDDSGDRRVLRSAAPGFGASPNFAGSWPVAWSEADWDARMPHLAGGGVDGVVRRRQVQITLSGAQLLPNGSYSGYAGRWSRITGDLNGDGCVEANKTPLGADRAILLANFGNGCY